MSEPPDGLPGQMGSNGIDQVLTSTSEASVKERTRQRILRGMYRISSSPSLSGLSRPKSPGSPYRSRSTSSCASLLATSKAPISQTNKPTTPPHLSPLSMESLSASLVPSPGFDVVPAPSPAAAPPSPAPAPAPAPALVFTLCESVLPDNEEHELIYQYLSMQNTVHGHSERPSAALSSAVMDVTTNLAGSSEIFHTSGFDFFDGLPNEIIIHIFSFLGPKERVRMSVTCRLFHKLCFDGQLWRTLDASEFYDKIPAASLTNIIASAGPFINYLNLRGCLQIEHYKRAAIMVRSCTNLVCATLEGCRNFPRQPFIDFLENNGKLVHLNLTGVWVLTNAVCDVLATSCPNLESLNVSWCTKVDALGLKKIVDTCLQLKQLDAGEVKGFDGPEIAKSIFRTNRLEKLVLRGCKDLSDDSLSVMMRGIDPEKDILTGLPIVPPRKLRYLDLSRCERLTSRGVEQIGYVTPELEVLQLSRCKSLGDSALIPILASTPRLTHLELEDVVRLTSGLFSDHLAKAPCASRLEHLGLSSCDRVGDAGLIPVLKTCVWLQRIDLDNTRISDLVLAEAVAMVKKRSHRTKKTTSRPKTTLHLSIFDCPNVTWSGIKEVLFFNSRVKHSTKNLLQSTYPTEMIEMKVFYGFQLIINEHHKRVLRGDFAAAKRLEKKWTEYMQETEGLGGDGLSFRQRRRRDRETQAIQHALDQHYGVLSRPRARTLGSCSVM